MKFAQVGYSLSDKLVELYTGGLWQIGTGQGTEHHAEKWKISLLISRIACQRVFLEGKQINL